jgi:hypothetical protein
MAHAAYVVWETGFRPDGTQWWVIQVGETDAGAASAWTTKNGTGNTVLQQTGNSTSVGNPGPQVAKDLILPRVSYVKWIQVVPESGTATTVAPMLGCAEIGTFSSGDVSSRMEIAAEAAPQELPLPAVPIVFPVSWEEAGVGERFLTGMPVPDAGSDNNINWLILLESRP